jgi:hypothetical protein
MRVEIRRWFLNFIFGSPMIEFYGEEWHGSMYLMRCLFNHWFQVFFEILDAPICDCKGTGEVSEMAGAGN